MRPLPFVFPHAVVFWLVWIWTFMPEWRIVQQARIDSKNADSKDAGSIRVIMAAMWISFLLSFVTAWVRLFAFPAGAQLYTFYVGVALFALGSLLRRACWRALGEFFTGDVRARADQPVIQTGPYRWVRHPSYTAAMLIFIGIGLALGNWLSLALLTTGAVVAYGYRVKVEERALVQEIGEPYVQYMRTHKRFVPGII